MSAETVIDVVGATPLVRLEHLVPHNGSEVWVKLEGNNPAGSIKDRAARSMIEEAEKRGDIKPGDVLVEATSGNTGIALAMIMDRLEGVSDKDHPASQFDGGALCGHSGLWCGADPLAR